MAFVTSFNETFASLANWVVLSAANGSSNGYPGGPAQFGTDEIETVGDDPSNLAYSAGNLRITPTLVGGTWHSARIETARCFKPSAGSIMRVEARIKLPNVHGAAAAGYWPAFWMMGSWQRDDRWIWPACFEFDVMESVNGINTNTSTIHGGPRSAWYGPYNEPEGFSNHGIAPTSGDLWGEFHDYSFEWDRTTTTDTMRWYVDGAQVWTARPATISGDWAAAANQPGMFIILNVAMGGQFPAKMGGGPTGSTTSGASMTVQYVRVSYDGSEAAEAATGNNGRGGSPTPPPVVVPPDPTPPPITSPTPTPTGNRVPISTAAPLYSPGASYYPVDTTRTSIPVPVPTNSWFENWLVGTGREAINVFPYELKVQANGLDICVPQLNTSSPNAVLATMLQNMSFRATTTSTSQKVTGFTDLGCSIVWNNGMSTYVVRGAAYVTMNYNGITPVVNSQNAVIAVNGTSVGATGTFTGTKFKFVLNNGQTWLLYSSGSVTLTLSTANTLTAGAAFTGTMRLALLPTAGDETVLDTNATCIPIGGVVDYSVTGNTATETYSFTTSGSGNLLMYAMLHHQPWLVSPTYASPIVTTLRGPMRAVIGNVWTMSIPLPVVSWDNSQPIASSRLSAINTALTTDRSFVPVVSDPYFGGKQLAKSARLALIADQLGNTAARDQLLSALKPVISTYLTGNALRYDTVWGGIVSSAGLSNQDADFGNGRYNDHHFHYGYAIYAAAVIAKFDSTWLATYKTRINDLVRDIANPSADDPYFTPMRNFDWFEGHSWAAGNFEFGDNRNQESTSEAVNAWYGLYLWGLVTTQNQLRDLGRVLFAQEVATAQRYWQIKQADTLYPSPFKQNGVVGILWSNKVDYATFFGAQGEYVHGIQMLPVTPATEVLIPDSWISETWPNNLLPLWSRTSVWRADIVSGGSGYVPANTSPSGQGYTDGLVASGGSGSGLGFNVNITGGKIVGVYIIFNQHGTGYTDGSLITLNGSGGTGAQIRVWTQPEDGWKAVLLGAYSQISPDDAWTRTTALTSFDDGSSKTQALVHIASQTPDTGTSLTGAALSTSLTTGALADDNTLFSALARSTSTTTGLLDSTVIVVPVPPDPLPGTTPTPPPAPVPPVTTQVTCESNNEDGIIALSGVTPNGNAVITRHVANKDDFLVREGARVISTGGFVIADAEAPPGVPVRYQTDVSGITITDRVIQRNLMLTPTFARGVVGWTAGVNRTLTTTPDPSSRTGTVGRISANPNGTAAGAPPTLIGHVNSLYGEIASYTLTPPTTGGTAIAVNDWMVLTHTQGADIALPPTPAGWTLLASTPYGPRWQIIWIRKRATGDAGYTVVAPTGANSISTLLWVRGASDEVVSAGPDQMAQPGLSTVTVTGRRAVLRPSLVASVFSATATIATTGAPNSASVSGATWSYNHLSGSGKATIVVATTSMANNGDSPTVTTTFNDVQSAGLGTQVIFQTSGTVANQVIAKAKAAIIPSSPVGQPYLLTGRVRFTTPALWTWQDVLDQGTWQHLKDTKPTWADVRGASAVSPGGNFINLFLTIVDPATGLDYITPHLALSMGESSLNQWKDFSVLFDVPGENIPATAEIRLSHGTNVKEYPVVYYFDELGVTPGTDRAVHATRYWFSGDSTPPVNSEDYLLPGGGWDAAAGDATMVWSGEPSNSVSIFYGPSAVTRTIECGLDPPTPMPCEPVLISDPTDAARRFWACLISIDDTTHPANRSLYRALDRADAISTSTVRNWQESTLVVQTDTPEDRDLALLTLERGKVILLRNPNTAYPERDWYLSVGDVTESRVSPNHREPHRFWTIPFTRVARPTGDIENVPSITWADVKAMGTWENVKTVRKTWLGVATGRSS